MKIGFPVESDSGIESIVYGHFGSAPAFIIVDTDTNQVTSLENGNMHHEHGSCNPIMALNGAQIDTMVVGGIGPGALMKLNAMGIKVYGAGSWTVAENIALFNRGQLQELSMENSCRAHQGQCAH